MPCHYAIEKLSLELQLVTGYLVLCKLIQEPASNLYDLELKPQTPELVSAQQYLHGDQAEHVCI